MGKKITIYDSGQTYEIDSELIYVPTFEETKKENKDDTESKTD